MRHNVFGRKLNRNHKSRQILFKSLVNKLIEHEKIKTTEARAKAIKGLVDKLVFEAQTKTSVSKTHIQAFVGNRQSTEKLVNVIAPTFAGRTGGFTRIIHLGNRTSDDTSMVQMEFVELSVRPENQKIDKKAPVKKEQIPGKVTRRKRGNETNKKK